jgi:hypothetical protein
MEPTRELSRPAAEPVQDVVFGAIDDGDISSEYQEVFQLRQRPQRDSDEALELP